MIGLYKAKHKYIPRIIIKLFAFQMFRAVAFLHVNNICHRNIAPDNILVNPANMTLKICDFGSAKFMQRGEVIM
jgi:glycogen synthase kinase 3 beta